MRRQVLVALLVALVPSAAVAQRVAVVPLGEGDDRKASVRVARAIRAALKAKGQQAIDPARALRPLPGAPDEALARGEERFRAGLALYDSLEFKKAEAAFQEAVQAHRGAIALGSDPKGYVRALHYLGASSLFESRKAAALARFADAIAFAPGERPDGKVFSPEVIAAYSEARTRAKGTLRVSLADNEVGEVVVDRKWAGLTPLSLSLAAGHHLVEVRRAGRAPSLVWKEVPAGGEVSAELTLSTPESLAAYRGAEAASAKELEGKPGSGVASLRAELKAGEIVLVSRQGGTVIAAWSGGGAWTRRYQGSVEEGREASFAEGLLSASVVAGGCTSERECGSDEACSSGRCVPAASRPIYKRWWFWTAIGAVAAGTAVGLAVGLSSRQREWTAELATRGGP
jgi:hypothetical protein